MDDRTTYKVKTTGGLREADKVRRLVDLKSGATIDFDSVGAGISHMLPVLLAAADTHRGTLLSIAQPELHLHPNLQAKLLDILVKYAADVPGPWRKIPFSAEGHATFEQRLMDLEGSHRHSPDYVCPVESTSGAWPWTGPIFLLETHSEAMILRLMRRMKETVRGTLPLGIPGVQPQHVALLYVEPGEHGSKVHELELASDGTLLDPWPGGFFSDALKDALT
jgi:predicted ATPase